MAARCGRENCMPQTLEFNPTMILDLKRSWQTRSPSATPCAVAARQQLSQLFAVAPHRCDARRHGGTVEIDPLDLAASRPAAGRRLLSGQRIFRLAASSVIAGIAYAERYTRGELKWDSSSWWRALSAR